MVNALSGNYPLLGQNDLEDIGKWLCNPDAPKYWDRPYTEQHPDGNWYLIIPGHGFNLHLRIDEIGSIDGFLDDTSGG